ncbi:Fe-S cluster assembly scaffold protein NifU [Malonomonas rubra]|uniref:Fe-S cluster assembly scaffold protein NifU n=1 Tax=Malonomonas rubra TaxID=57040 RepID=UPI0026EDA77A|nr:Fe-S cluster assembly scaffold protein NifU [Malonomonas rubra]
MYTDKVMDHFSNPRNVGEIEDANGVGEVGNASCGDIMKIFLKVEDNIIKDVKFKTFGCGAAIATSSMVTEMAIGRTIEEALVLTNEAVAEALDGLPPAKMHCSNLAADALHEAIKNYKEQNS